MAKTKTQKKETTGLSDNLQELHVGGLDLHLQQKINYRTTFGDISVGVITKFKQMGEDSWWMYIRDAHTGTYDWISINVQLSHLEPEFIMEAKISKQAE